MSTAVRTGRPSSNYKNGSPCFTDTYFDAKDAAALNDAMARALRPAFEVVDAKGQVIAEGIIDSEAIRVPAGTVGVRIKGSNAKPTSVVVKQKETTSMEL